MMADSFKIPNWTGKPPPGLHLDVMKNDTLIQKVMVDEKNSYFFGRGPQNDICIEHSSSSRIHAVLLHHKQLRMAFLVDLGSTHGTFIGSVRLEPHKPTQLPVDTTFRFGASTRSYLIREPIAPPMEQEEMDEEKEDGKGVLLGLPATGTELQNLTEFNTANNRRVSVVGIAIGDDSKAEEKKRKSFKQRTVSFCEEEEIINLEDVDPSVGKFRNLVTSTVIPTFSKRQRFVPIPNFGMGYPRFRLDDYREPQYSPGASIQTHSSTPFPTYAAGLDLPIPNSAPEVTETKLPSFFLNSVPMEEQPCDQDDGTKKTYVKEAWPGKRSGKPFSF